MFIKMSTDAATNKAIISLQKLYPTERTILPQELANVPKEANGSLPRRITFFGHGRVTNFGNKSVEEFSDMVVSQLTAYAEKEPGIKKSLTTIDLLGCNIGHDESNRTSFAAAVTARVNQELQQKGFKEIRFNAVTNLLSRQPEKFSSTILIHNYITGKFSVKCTKPEDENKASRCRFSIQAKKNGLARIENRIDLLDNKIAALQAQRQNISTELTAKKQPSKASDPQSARQKPSGLPDSKNNKDLKTKRKELRGELRSIKEIKEYLTTSLAECNAKIEQTQRDFNTEEGKYHQNVLQLEKTEDEKRALNMSIKGEVAKVHSDAVASGSKWVSNLQTCLDELDANKNLDINTSLSIVTNAIQGIRKGWFGSPSIFGPGSTSATKLETLVANIRAADIANRNTPLEAKEKELREENVELKNQVRRLDQQLQIHENIWQKLQAEYDKTEKTKMLLEKEYHQSSSGTADQTTPKEISTLGKQINMLDAKISTLTREKETLITNKEKIKTDIIQLNQKETSLRTVIHGNENDPRKILDDPRCNFTALVTQEQQIGNAPTHRA